MVTCSLMVNYTHCDLNATHSPIYHTTWSAHKYNIYLHWDHLYVKGKTLLAGMTKMTVALHCPWEINSLQSQAQSTINDLRRCSKLTVILLQLKRTSTNPNVADIFQTFKDVF